MITLNSASPIPPFEQIRTQLADLIKGGALPGSHRLPSIRQLAGDLRIAPGTVVRAYAALEAEGLIEMSRASGTRVKAGQHRKASLEEAAAQFVSTTQRGTDVTLEDALGAVRTAWERAAGSVVPS